MSAKRMRPGGVEVPEWWSAEARDKAAQLRLRQEEIATAAAVLMPGWVADQSRVSRCLRGDNATIPLLNAISTVLGITPPVLVAESHGEAAAIAAVRDKTVAPRRPSSVGMSGDGDDDDGRADRGAGARRRRTTPS